MKKYQSGFSLMEVMLVIVLIGIVSAMVAPQISMSLTFIENARRNENILSLQKIADGLLSFARNSNNGSLPAPFTGGDWNAAIYNPTGTTPLDTSLAMELRNTGVPAPFINTDSSVSENLRVYQLVSGVTQNIPLYLTTGPQITLIYDIGALVQTECPKSDSCNSGIPGDSVDLTASNATTWMPSGNDYGGIIFSTLPEQKSMLRTTVGRLNRLNDRLASEFYTRMRLAAANSTTNFFPTPTGAGAANLSGANPATNQGCHNGWYVLNAANVNVLAQLGLDPSEYGVTAWNAPIHYCADYEPLGVSSASANTPPHYAALRMNRNPRLAPAALANSNVIITF